MKNNFLVKYGFLVLVSFIAVSLVVLMNISWKLMPSNVVNEVEITGFNHELSLKTIDPVLLPNELLIVEAYSEDERDLISGKMHVNYPGSLLKLVRASANESVMNNGKVPLKLNVTSSLFHGAEISFANPSLNGLEVPEGKLMTLYFVAKGIGEGKIDIDYSNSSVEDSKGGVGIFEGDVGVDFRIE